MSPLDLGDRVALAQRRVEALASVAEELQGELFELAEALDSPRLHAMAGELHRAYSLATDALELLEPIAEGTGSKSVAKICDKLRRAAAALEAQGVALAEILPGAKGAAA